MSRASFSLSCVRRSLLFSTLLTSLTGCLAHTRVQPLSVLTMPLPRQVCEAPGAVVDIPVVDTAPGPQSIADTTADAVEPSQPTEPPVPPIVHAPIVIGPLRRAQTLAFVKKHYGMNAITFTPRAIVLHYTCGPSYASARTTFANNHQFSLEPPGACAQYIIDTDGTIYELVPPTMWCKHCIGIDHTAIGIEFVQRCMRGGPRVADRMILDRTPQIEAGLALVRYLRHRFDIPPGDIIGHGMSVRSHLFIEKLGWKSDHSDWREADVLEFRQRL